MSQVQWMSVTLFLLLSHQTHNCKSIGHIPIQQEAHMRIRHTFIQSVTCLQRVRTFISSLVQEIGIVGIINQAKWLVVTTGNLQLKIGS